MLTVYRPRIRCGQSHLSVCLSVCDAVTFESLDLESHFRCAAISSEYLGQVEVHISRSPGQGQGHRSKESVSAHPVRGVRASIERQSFLSARRYVFSVHWFPALDKKFVTNIKQFTLSV